MVKQVGNEPLPPGLRQMEKRSECMYRNAEGFKVFADQGKFFQMKSEKGKADVDKEG